jgi:hypothetical protein
MNHEDVNIVPTRYFKKLLQRIVDFDVVVAVLNPDESEDRIDDRQFDSWIVS